MTEQPDFEKLRAERNEAVRKEIDELCEKYGWNPKEMHTSFDANACYCNCANGGPCEHKWDGPGLDLDNGWTATCSRCGMTAMGHDMRNGP